MISNLTSINTFLGKYSTELLYSATQEKYKNTDIDAIFEQRFRIQDNKAHMIVDPGLSGLVVTFAGNEIHISKELFDHPDIAIVNSIETGTTTNPRSLYSAETFSTLAYLICQNHTTLQITGEVEEPIYVKYKSDYETFYNSVVIFDISAGVEVEIVEEIESLAALNVVTNYIMHAGAHLDLFTFYQNRMSAVSMVYRNIIAQESSRYCHTLFGKGSAGIVDENKIHAYSNSRAELLGLVSAPDANFHSILYVDPIAADYSISVDYRSIVNDNSSVTFFPGIIGQLPGSDVASIVVSNIDLDQLPPTDALGEINQYISDITERAVLSRIVGVHKFYKNKSKFLQFP